jgi:hypothetical protein
MPHPRSAASFAALTLSMLGATSSVLASEPAPSARASFDLLEEPKTADSASLPPPMSPPPAAAAPAAEPAAPSFSYADSPSQAPLEYRAPAYAGSAPPSYDRPAREREISDEWMLSVEGVTHAPIDAGIQAGIEFPFGLRLFGGYGWVPSAYLDVIVDAASAASDSNPETETVIANAFESGTAWRIQAGLRPFRNFGLYVDVGYSRLNLDGALDAGQLAAVAGVPAGSIGSDMYTVDSTIHMWLVELGYQAVIADRLVLGVAAGLMGTIDANTNATPSAERPPAQEAAIRRIATEIVDQQIEDYGFVPTLTLRLGFDLI